MKINKIIISILLLILFICIGNSVYATTISFSNESPQVGDSVKITVSVPNVHTADVTAVVSGAGTSGQIKVVGGDMMGNKTTLSNSITVKPTSAGTITVSITSLSNAVADGQYVNVAASRSITVSTPPPPPSNPEPDPTPTIPSTPNTPSTPTEPTKPTEPSKSSVAILADLGIRPNDFSGFSKNPGKEVWQVTVPSDVSEIEVYAKAGQKGTVISGTGMKKLVEGTNSFKVVVQSEDGTKTKTYTIIVTRKVEEGEITPNTNDNAENEETENDITSGLSKLEIAGLTFTPEFDVNEYKYIIEGKLEDFKSVEEFKKLITAEANFEGAKIEIASEEEEFKVGRNKILITVKDSDGREIAIYTIVLKLTERQETVVGKIEDNNEKDEKREIINIEWNKIIVISAIVLMAIYSIIVSIISYNQRKVLELKGIVEEKEDDNYNPFEEIKIKEEKMEQEEKNKSIKMDELDSNKVIEESEEEIRRRKIDEFLRGREGKH